MNRALLLLFTAGSCVVLLTPSCGGASTSDLITPGGPITEAGNTPRAEAAAPDTSTGNPPAEAAAEPAPDTGTDMPESGPSSGVNCPASNGTPSACQANDFCCLDVPTRSGACEGTGSTCNGPTLYCDKAADCGGGDVCCLTRGNGRLVSTCKARCQDIVLCGGTPDCAALGESSTCQPENDDLMGIYTACQ